MKKRRNLITSIFIVLSLGLSFYQISHKIWKTKQIKAAYQSIPSFRIPDIDGNIVTEASIQGYRTVMFLFFNPDCDLCRNEMSQIKEDETAFSQGKIIFFSEQPADSIRQFLQTIDFEPVQNMLFLSDEKATLISKMEANTSPTIYIYQQGQLIKRFNGPVKIETLIRYFTEE